jgi:hypothetical protein
MIALKNSPKQLGTKFWLTTNCDGHHNQLPWTSGSNLSAVSMFPSTCGGFFLYIPKLTHDFHNSVGVQFWKKHIPIQLSSATTNWWNPRKIPMMIFELPRAIIQHHPLSIIHCQFSTYFSDWDQPQKNQRVGVIVRRWSWDLIFFSWGTKWYEKNNIHDMKSDIHGYTGKKNQLACSELTPLYWWLVAHEHLWTMKYPVNPSWIKGLYPLVI